MNTHNSYYVAWLPPADCALSDLGRALTGYDPDLGDFCPSDPLLAKLIAPATTSRSGLFAPLSGRLVADGGLGEWPLLTVLELLSERLTAFALPPLALVYEERQIVLAPAKPSVELSGLMNLLDARLARVYPAMSSMTHRAPPLGGVVPAPFAPAGFRVPLTNPLAPDEAEMVLPKLEQVLSPVLESCCEMSSIALLCDFGLDRRLRRVEEFSLLDRADDLGSLSSTGRSALTDMGSGQVRMRS
ncbi:MAG: hypothetical protein AAFQ88_07325 [Pseudomonadota bacterium]